MFEEAASALIGCLCFSMFFFFRSPPCQSLSRASARSGGQPCEIPLLCKGQPSCHTLQVRSQVRDQSVARAHAHVVNAHMNNPVMSNREKMC